MFYCFNDYEMSLYKTFLCYLVKLTKNKENAVGFWNDKKIPAVANGCFGTPPTK